MKLQRVFAQVAENQIAAVITTSSSVPNYHRLSSCLGRPISFVRSRAKSHTAILESMSLDFAVLVVNPTAQEAPRPVSHIGVVLRTTTTRGSNARRSFAGQAATPRKMAAHNASRARTTTRPAKVATLAILVHSLPAMVARAVKLAGQGLPRFSQAKKSVISASLGSTKMDQARQRARAVLPGPFR